MDRLQGRTAIVTGGASDIGAATARLFAAEGARVLIADIDNDSGEKLAGEIGPSAIARHLDVTQQSDWQRCVTEFFDHFGNVDILVNNAGSGTGGPLLYEPLDGHRRTLDVNVTGVWLGMRAVVPVMMRQGTGTGH